MNKAILMGTLLAAACTTAPPEAGAPPPGRQCNAAPRQGLVGQPASASLGEEVLRRTGARVLRWLQPGQVITLEYSYRRVNVKLDAQNRVEGITCG